MSSQTQNDKEQTTVQTVGVETQEEYRKLVVQNEVSPGAVEKDEWRVKPGWECCDPDLIEIGGGNPWNFYPL